MPAMAVGAKVGPGGSGGRSSRRASRAAAPQMPQADEATRLRCQPTRSSLARGRTRRSSTRFSASGRARSGNGATSSGSPDAATAPSATSSRVADEPLDEEQAEDQLEVVARRAHDDRERLAVEDDLERLLGRDDVVAGQSAVRASSVRCGPVDAARGLGRSSGSRARARSSGSGRASAQATSSTPGSPDSTRPTRHQLTPAAPKPATTVATRSLGTAASKPPDVWGSKASTSRAAADARMDRQGRCGEASVVGGAAGLDAVSRQLQCAVERRAAAPPR